MKKVFLFFFLLIFGGLCFSLFLRPSPVSSDGTYTGIGTADGLDGSADAITFSQGRVWTIDKYGKYIWITQGRATASHWAWSNDLGANWTQGSESYSFLTRGSVAYDSINDKLHVIWTATAASDGIIYRRYGITRDGSNNITAITREDASNINLQLDTSSSGSLEQAIGLWVNDGSTNGSLLAFWSKSGTGFAEIRGSMRSLSLTSDDGTAGNWVAIDGTGDTFSIDAPAVAADKIFSANNGTTVAGAAIRGGTGSRKDDLYVFVAANQSTNNNIYAYRAIWSSGSSNWSGGWQSPVTIGSMENQSGGYNLKHQLITKPVLDSTNDRLYIGWARWKDVTNGDTVSIAYLDSTDNPSSTVDVYSALGTHSYAPTLDIAYDQTLNVMYVAYLESTTNGDNGSMDYKTYDGSTLSSSTRFYTSPGGAAGADGSGDIPILYENRSSNNRLLFAFRVNGALPPTALNPHTIDWGYVTLLTPTPTPTVTPTPTPTDTPTPTSTPTTTPTPTSSSTSTSSSSVSSTTNPPGCGDMKPPTPDLYAITIQNSTSLKLFFTDPGDGFQKYIVRYGLAKGSYVFGSDPVAFNGDRTALINSLTANTTYYFQIRTQNGCMPGNWSNELSGKTQSLFQAPQKSTVEVVQTEQQPENTVVENVPTSQPAPTQESTITPSVAPASTTYSVTIQVKDEKENPLPNTKVTLHSNPQTTVTDENGIASFTNVESGEHQLIVQSKNYSGEQTISVGGSSPEVVMTVIVKPNRTFSLYYVAFGFILALVTIWLVTRFRKTRG